jgi:hypothetical protein
MSWLVMSRDAIATVTIVCPSGPGAGEDHLGMREERIDAGGTPGRMR